MHGTPAVYCNTGSNYKGAQTEDVQHAMMLVDSMPAEGLEPDEATWGLLLEAAHILRHDELRAAVSLLSF